MRVVLDTNVVVRAVAAPDGPAAQVLDLLGPSHVLIVSSTMLDELARVLRYPRVRQLHGRDDAELDQLVDSLRTGSVVVSTLPDVVPVVVPDDRDDDFVLATALAGGADLLCTRDQHLHDPQMKEYAARRNLRILTDIELLGELRAPDADG